jgi:Ca-activated chloride channel family protein
MIRFADPQFLWGLLAIPLLVGFYLWAARSRSKALERFGNPQLLEKLMIARSPGRRKLKKILVVSGVFFCLLALARPQIGTRLEEVKRQGLDIFVAVDVSRSMLAEDIQPNRLSKARLATAGLINRLEGDRIGLIVFAGEAFVQCPLTLDYGAAKMFLDIIHPDLIPLQGTALGAAIDRAVDSFVQTERKYKVLILITDGEDTVEDPMEAAQRAEKEGVIIFTVGIGSPEGVPIPDFDSAGRNTGYKKDEDGNIVMTRLDSLTLEKIALQTNGKYYQATPSEMELGKIYETVSGMEQKQLSSRIFSQFEDRFQYLLALGLLFLLAELFLPDRRRVKMEWRGRFE